MRYVLDTGFFRAIKEYYPKVFLSFWQNMGKAAASGRISSVQEVLRELDSYRGHRVHMDEWVDAHKHIFTAPSPREAAAVRRILAVPRFDHLVKGKAMREGKPVADPFVIAKALVTGGAVVSNELPGKVPENQKFSQHPHIPDVCRHFDIPWLTPAEFMEQEGWKF